MMEDKIDKIITLIEEATKEHGDAGRQGYTSIQLYWQGRKDGLSLALSILEGTDDNG